MRHIFYKFWDPQNVIFMKKVKKDVFSSFWPFWPFFHFFVFLSFWPFFKKVSVRPPYHEKMVKMVILAIFIIFDKSLKTVKTWKNAIFSTKWSNFDFWWSPHQILDLKMIIFRVKMDHFWSFLVIFRRSLNFDTILSLKIYKYGLF